MNKGVFVTGLGVVTSIGVGKDEFWKHLLEGCSGISDVSIFDTSSFQRHKAGEIKGFDIREHIDDKRAALVGRSSQFGILAAKLALEDAGLTADMLSGATVAVIAGTTMTEGTLLDLCSSKFLKDEWDDITGKMLINTFSPSIAQNIGSFFRFNGLNMLVPNACAAGNFTIDYGYDLIRSGLADVVIAGGAESLSRVAFGGFQRLRAMSEDVCSPFDKNRKGMLLGEGAGILVLESEAFALRRRAGLYAQIKGCGISCDAHHITIPNKIGVKKAIKKALDRSGVPQSDVSYVCAHGTGTPANDKVESQAVREVFDELDAPPAMSSIKSMLGHCMGASSAIEAAACCLTLQENVLPPTINFSEADPECDIDCVANKARKAEVKAVINNGFAFGGNNSCVVFSKV